MKPPADEPHSFFHTVAFGTLCGLAAAVAYTACDVCLRVVKDVDPFFVSTIRAIPTVVVLAPIVLARPWQGLPLLPPWRIVAILTATGFAGHVLGNSSFQYGLGIVGVALAVPLCLGSMIVGGATLGRVLLNEPITYRMAAGLSLLIAAIFAALMTISSFAAGLNLASAVARTCSSTPGASSAVEGRLHARDRLGSRHD